jgi:hypothetical protein
VESHLILPGLNVANATTEQTKIDENLLVGIKKIEYALHAVKTVFLVMKKCALNVQQNAIPRECQDTMPIPKNSRKKIESSKKASIREEAITDYAFIAVKLRQMRDIKRVLSAVTNLKSRNV